VEVCLMIVIRLCIIVQESSYVLSRKGKFCYATLCINDILNIL
jgi:hypothetical protein